MRKVGICCEVDRYDLAARCRICLKNICYPLGVPISLDAWNAKLKEFTDRHNRDCGKKGK